MLAWEVFVFRNAEAKREDLIVHWMTSSSGLDWLDQLVKAGKASENPGCGYPDRYLIAAGVLLPILYKGLPSNRSPPVIGDDYFIPEGWNGSVVWEQDAKTCSESDILLIEAWDQS